MYWDCSLCVCLPRWFMIKFIRHSDSFWFLGKFIPDCSCHMHTHSSLGLRSANFCLFFNFLWTVNFLFFVLITGFCRIRYWHCIVHPQCWFCWLHTLRWDYKIHISNNRPTTVTLGFCLTCLFFCAHAHHPFDQAHKVSNNDSNGNIIGFQFQATSNLCTFLI